MSSQRLAGIRAAAKYTDFTLLDRNYHVIVR